MADGEPAATAFGFHTNRRDLPSPALTRCRVCWKPITQAVQRIEAGERYPFLHCPHCGCAFPIRREDVARRAPLAS